MNRAVFIIIGVAICAIVTSVIKKPSGVSISNVQGVQCPGGTYQAVMASRGGKVEQIVLSNEGATFTLSESGMGYKVTYATIGFGGESKLREDTVPSAVCVFDRDRGVRSVNYSGSVDDLGEKIRKREKLDITFTP